MKWLTSQFQALQVSAKLVAEIVAAQRKLDSGFQESELVAGVVARAFKTITINRPVAKQMLQAVGELDFASAPRFDRFEGLENLGCEHVAADNSQVRRRFRRLRLLHHVANPEQAVLAAAVRHRLGVDGAIG